MSPLLFLVATRLPAVREPVTIVAPLEVGERRVGLGYTSSVPGLALDLRTGRPLSLAGGARVGQVEMRGAVSQGPDGQMTAVAVGYAFPGPDGWALSAEAGYSLGQGWGASDAGPWLFGQEYTETTAVPYLAHTPTLRLRGVTGNVNGFRVPVSMQGGVAWDSVESGVVRFFEVGTGAVWTLQGGLDLGVGVRVDRLGGQLGGYANASLGYRWGATL